MTSCQGQHSRAKARGLVRNTRPDAGPVPGAPSPGSATPVPGQNVWLPPASNCLWACDLDLQTRGLSPELPTQLPTVPTSSGPRGCCGARMKGQKQAQQRRGQQYKGEQAEERAQKVGVTNSGDCLGGWAGVGGVGGALACAFLHATPLLLLPSLCAVLVYVSVSPLWNGDLLAGPNN